MLFRRAWNPIKNAIGAIGLHPFFGDQIREMFEGAVKGSFGVFREKAARQLPFFQVVGNAVAADSLAGAGFIGAAADPQVSFFFAVQGKYSFGKLTSHERRVNSEKVSWLALR